MDRVTARRAATPWKPRVEPALQTLPKRTALDMPIQSLERDETRGARARFADSHPWRRTLLLSATGASTAAAAAVMAGLLAPKGYSPADWLMLGLFVVLFAWVAFAFVSATAGFLLALRARAVSPIDPQPIVFTRTALLMPTYNEDPGRILSGAQAIYEELDALGVAELYDIYVLSDTRDAAIAQAEATGVVRLRLRLDAPDRIFYRRRPVNRDRKAGNIADWVTKFGAGYESMIILDADSLMTGDTIVRLTAAMERDEKAGLIQRKEGETDRRSKIILLTPRGRAIADKVETVARRIRTDALAGLSEADIETTLRVLDHVCRVLDPSAEPPQ